MRREPPEVEFVREERVRRLGGPDALVGVANVCPIEGCDAWSHEDEPDCEHEYPGRCAACDTIVGCRYDDLVWMGTWLGADQWLCERCRGYCEECDSYDKIALDGVCADCCRIVAAGGVLHEGKKPTLELLWMSSWRRIDHCEGCDAELPPLTGDEPELLPMACSDCLREDDIHMQRLAHGGDG